MGLSPDPIELMTRARADLRMGVPVVFTDGAQSILCFAVETLSQSRLNDLHTLPAAPFLTLTARRAQTLKIAVYDADIARISVPKGAPLSWLQSMADPSDDLNNPMKGPFNAIRDPNPDLPRAVINLIKSARLLPAALVVSLPDGAQFAADNHLTLLVNPSTAPVESPPKPVASARLPLEVSDAGRLHIFRLQGSAEEHYAIEIGQPSRDAPVLTRLHSACFTGDLLGSLKCDCGPQLRASLAQMGAQGTGVLLYLNQEGRGIGLANKMRAYSLQDQGFDTVQANHRLGFEDDERDFRIGADILKQMGFSDVLLLTNNPKKVAMMQATGINVAERVPLIVGENPHNHDYLKTKAAKSGHLL